MSKNTAGYTLVELVFSLAILTVAFVGGYTAYRDFTRREALSNAVDELKLNLGTIRSKSISAERPSQGECGGEYLGYVVIFSANSYVARADCVASDPSSSSAFYKTYTLPDGISLSVTVNQILFKSLGSGTDITDTNGAIITVNSDAGGTQTVTVFPRGNLK